MPSPDPAARLLPIATLVLLCASPLVTFAEDDQPNILFILTDDHRHDAIGASGNQRIRTPHLDRLAEAGTRFSNAFVTLAICSPSRAACLTGRYGSANGVTSVGKVHLNAGEPLFPRALKRAGYATGVTGKWHLKTTPAECGFEFASTCWSNGPWYDRRFNIDGQDRVMYGFVDSVAAAESVRFIRKANSESRPFLLWFCTQVPHMDHRHSWPAAPDYLDRYVADEMPLPQSWNDSLTDKPLYLQTARNRTQAERYGYDNPENIRAHVRDYYASVEQMDAAVGNVIDELERLQIRENTWIIVMGDNGWMLGEHGMTSKVLPYEESMRVPLFVVGPDCQQQISNDLVLNIDVTATLYELAGLEVPKRLHGRSLTQTLKDAAPADWRKSFLYQAPTPQLGSRPLWAVRTERWKYVETQLTENSTERFAELYDLHDDSAELTNLANQPEFASIQNLLASELDEHQERIRVAANSETQATNEKLRTDISISGVYPHLTTYGVYSQKGAHNLKGHNECGIGAIVPWAGKLWMVNYAPHRPNGSEHKLFSIDPDLHKPMTIHKESVGGTPAGRMIHPESKQLLIAHYLIDESGKVRVIPPSKMPIRVTAIARHLIDPEHKVYYIDMEGSIWEADVYTLDVKKLFKKPVPGWHGKGGYTSQGRLVVSNNGELHVGNYDDLLVGGAAKSDEDRGVLAEFDGQEWRIVERRQFTEVTGPSGISGGNDHNDPIWAIGWDRRSLRLKVLEEGQWHTFLLPKASYCNDASHGWYTEWPRIREVTDGKWLLDMHGMFFDFPKSFTASKPVGIRPIGSHLRYVPDFCAWNNQLVLASDETSIQGNPLAGQPQSNLWFGSVDELEQWGPRSAYGGPWIEDAVKANTPSTPFLIQGFQRRLIHLTVDRKRIRMPPTLRSADEQPVISMPEELYFLPRVAVDRGSWHEPGEAYEFVVNEPVKVYVAVDRRGAPKLNPRWQPAHWSVTWGKGHRDDVYVQEFPPGKIPIPHNATEHTKNAYGMPHLAFVKGSKNLKITAIGGAKIEYPPIEAPVEAENTAPVEFQISTSDDCQNWTPHESITVPVDGYAWRTIPAKPNSTWLRIAASRDCIATAFLHLTTSEFPDGNAPENKRLFAGLAEIGEHPSCDALVYPAKRNRNLRLITAAREFIDFSKSTFQYTRESADLQLQSRLEFKPVFTVDESSVIVDHQGQKYRLPKGPPEFDSPFASGWPRSLREVESERLLANIHGTFYEAPLVNNGAPPAWNLIRPVSSHRKQITDYCSWNGLLVLAGVKQDAANDGHVFYDSKLGIGLWFGGVDDLWKLGKPIGVGGPWKETQVVKGRASDPYLIRGYDRKTALFSHRSETSVNINVEIDIDGSGTWVDYKSFDIAPGTTVEHEFPLEFSACWIRGTSDSNACVTFQLMYR